MSKSKAKNNAQLYSVWETVLGKEHILIKTLL